MAWDNVITHFDKEIDQVIQAAQGRLVLLYLPTYSPWLNPIERVWRHMRRSVTANELFESLAALAQAVLNFFDRCNQLPLQICSIIGSHSA